MSNHCPKGTISVTAVVFACLVTLLPASLAAARSRAPARIEAVRVGGRDRAPTLRVRVTRRCRVVRTRLRAPERLVLDFTPARWNGRRPEHGPSTPVRAVRIAQHDGRRVRLVLDTEPRPTRWTGRFRGGEWVGQGKIQENRRAARNTELSDDRRTRGSLRGLVIGIDAGHGGGDPGAIAACGLQEKEVTLGIARRLRRLLRRQGVRTLMTRTDDRQLPKATRVAFVSNSGADLIVSIHCDALDGTPHCTGITTYYHGRSRRSQELAEALQGQLTTATGLPDRGARPDTTCYDSGFYVLRNATAPAVLVEAGYISSATTAARLRDPGFRQQIARGIVDGLRHFVATAPVRTAHR